MMVLAFNLGVVIILILYIVNSYFLSIKQNLFRLISLVLRIILAWVFAKILSKLILNINISNENYEYVINGEVIKNVVDIVKVIILKNYPNFKYLIQERKAITNIIESISLILIRAVLLILFYIVISIIYKIIISIKRKKDKKVIVEKSQRSKEKGLIFGFIQSALIVFLICIPLSGLSSIVNDLEKITNINELEEVKFIKSYRNTITGKAFSALNIDKKPLDLFFFDQVFMFKIKDLKIYLSEEINAYIEIIELLEERNFASYTLKEPKEIKKEDIDELLERLKDIKSLNISMPLLIDYFLINYYEITVDDTLYEVNYYNDCIRAGKLLILYLSEFENIDYNDLFSFDNKLLLEVLENISSLELLDKLSSNITKELKKLDVLTDYVDSSVLESFNLDDVNYKKEVTIIKDIFKVLFNDDYLDENEVNNLVLLISSSDFLNHNNEVLFEILISEFLKDYDAVIKRLPLKENDIKSLIVIAKAYIDNGFLDPHFRLSKLYDEESINIIVDAITTSELLVNNLSMIFKFYLIESNVNIDFNIYIPKDYDFKCSEGKEKLKNLLRLFQIINYGITQENLEKYLDEICAILEGSNVIHENIPLFLNWLNNKYNTTSYQIYIKDMDFSAPEGNKEIRSLINILRLVVNRRMLDIGISSIFSLEKEDIDLILESKIIEEACIHLLFDLGKGGDIPIVVNLALDDQKWYKTKDDDGELRNLLYAIKIIFKDVERVEDIKLSPELIISINDGTIDTNLDGEIDEKDENELLEIMKSKILSDSVIKYVYDYLKEQNKKIGSD